MNLRPTSKIDWLLLLVILMVLLTIGADQAKADTNRLLIGGWSKHLVSEDTTNSNHKVFGVEARGWAAGYFQNSYGRPTWFVNKAWRWPGFLGIEYLEATASAGVSYGYRECWGDDGKHAQVCPDGTLGIGWTQWRVVPSLKLKGDAVVFQPEVKF